ncbi:hypothetical protein M5K25_002504 [Dendrobium thyrsiflorum]|uniref:Reverse transcriptase domain-containing protein n=1 Tax=Dendrobium thyrsiflorum TaxID=117978 RepID=A0ABD0VUT0_DENTH
MTNNDFHDVGTVGPSYTWCNNKEEAARIWERLDRSLLNSAALQMVPLARIKHLARVASDHCPIILKVDEKHHNKTKKLRFEDTWRSYPAAWNIVVNSWKKSDFGNDGDVLKRKLCRTMKALFFWNKNKCKDLCLLKEQLKKEILELPLEESTDMGIQLEKLVLLRSKVHELNVTLRRLSTWWNQRAKAKWHEEGDTNSKFFHNFASARRNGNFIRQIKDEDNNLIEEVEQIEEVFLKFFKKKWRSRECNLTGWPLINEDQHLTFLEREMLSVEFTKEELKIAVFQQGKNKAPGFDGVTPSFFKSYWSIAEDITWKAIDGFFKSGDMYAEWKDTMIVLISKIKNPVLPSNYRPISLYQTTYKLVATMMINRVKGYISRLISKEQMAFIPGRSISEHCLLAHEIFNKFRISKNKNGMMAVKVDMEQAYDTMGWPTLQQILNWFSFPSKFSNLIMACVTNARFSIILNGNNSKWINARSGFRQGCPSSPYLFIMCSQLLSNTINQRGHDLGIQLSPGSKKVTHLLYADDVLMFSLATTNLAKLMKAIVVDFCGWTGQRININKSQIIFGKAVKRSLKRKVSRNLGFKVVKEMHYLGIKIMMRRLGVADFQEMLNHVLDKLNGWGRITLAKSSLLSMPNFIVMHSLVPKRVLYELDKICRDFIWHKPNGERGLHYVAWEEMCKLRSAGGLGMLYNELILLILQMPVKSNLDGDQLEFLFQHSGRSISALAYEEVMRRRTKEDDGGYSNWLKKLKLNHIVELFWWRLSKNAIPTNHFLKYRRLCYDDSCARGCQEEESNAHIMVQCRYLHELIQRLRDWGFSIPTFHDLGSCLEELKRLSFGYSNIVKMYCTAVYLSWKNCNEVKHGKPALSSPLVASNITVNLLRESHNAWHPPPLDWIKINMDASLLSSNLAGIGGVFRDYRGRLLLAFGRKKVHWDVAQLEMEAILALREHIQGWMMSSKGVIIEGDNFNIIKFIQSSMNKSSWKPENWVAKELFFLNDFNKVIFHHVNRDCNKISDLCATLALENSFTVNSFSFGNIPSSLFSLLKKECDHFISCN